MQKLNRTQANITSAFPEKILQFGGGNFLRGFVDWIVDIYNQKTGEQLGVLVIKPTQRGDYDAWREQDGLFHVLTKGIRDSKLVDEHHLVKCISNIIHPYHNWAAYLASAQNPSLRYIISNTTESGIRFSPDDQLADVPPREFPAKLTLWLYQRYRFFKGKEDAGCVLIPTELLMDNGDKLKDCILQYARHWNLETGFEKWLNEANTFCNTLVDRIIPGVGKEARAKVWEEVGFEDVMITQGEPYHLWAIEAPQSVREALPLDKIGLNIIYTDDLTPFRTSKVRLLNGAHTTMVPVGYLYGLETVQETVEHKVMGRFVRKAIFNEIIPTLDLPEMNLEQFANDVLDRFKNPFIKHRLISISLNSISKFKTRVLPSILEYEQQKGALPRCLVFSMAALVRFYKGEQDGKNIPLNDDAEAISFFQNLWDNCDGSKMAFSEMAEKVLQWEATWGQDLLKIPGMKNILAEYLIKIEKEGIKKAVSDLVKRS